MRKTISGKTILLNTKMNTTFIADDFCEEIQSGLRDIDIASGKIEWVGELDIAVCEHQFKDISEILWGLLDDIDTLSDICKPTIKDPKALMAFYNNAMRYAEERNKYLHSQDGFTLERNITPEPNLKEALSKRYNIS